MRRTRSCSGSTAPRGSHATPRTTYLHLLAEAERRDHRRLGAELDLFSFPHRDRQRPAGVPPQGRHHPAGDGGLLAAAAHRGRLRVRQHPAHHQVRPVRDLGPPGLVRRRHVPADGAGGREVLREADELPHAHPDLLRPRAVVPGAAAAAVRVRHRVPVREVRSRARPDPGPRLHPGRRAHLLHPGAAGRGAGVAARLRGRPAARLRADRVRGRAVHPPGEVRRRAGGVGGGRGGAQARPGCLGPALHGRRGRGGVLRAEDRRARAGRDRAHAGSCPPSRSISRNRAGSASSTRRRTAPGGGRT